MEKFDAAKIASRWRTLAECAVTASNDLKALDYFMLFVVALELKEQAQTSNLLENKLFNLMAERFASCSVEWEAYCKLINRN